MAFADQVIVRIMCRRDLHGSRPELSVNVFVGDDRYLAVRQRQRDGLADKIFVTLVAAINCNRRIAKHCFRASCSNNYEMRSAECGVRN